MRLLIVAAMTLLGWVPQEKEDPRLPPLPPGPPPVAVPKGHVRWMLPVSVQKGAPPEVHDVAKKWSQLLTPGTEPWVVDKNPQCVFCIEIDKNWVPFDGVEAYYLIIRDEGAILRATSVDQLKVALETLRLKVDVVKGERIVPKGLLTNYPLIK